MTFYVPECTMFTAVGLHPCFQFLTDTRVDSVNHIGGNQVTSRSVVFIGMPMERFSDTFIVEVIKGRVLEMQSSFSEWC